MQALSQAQQPLLERTVDSAAQTVAQNAAAKDPYAPPATPVAAAPAGGAMKPRGKSLSAPFVGSTLVVARESKQRNSLSSRKKLTKGLVLFLDPVTDAMNSFEIPTVIDTVAAGWPRDFKKIAAPIAQYGFITCSLGFAATIIEQRYPKRFKKELAIIDAIRDGINAGTWLLIAECSIVADALVLQYRAQHNGHDEGFQAETNISTGAFIGLCIPPILVGGAHIVIKLSEDFKEVKVTLTNKISNSDLRFLSSCLDFIQDTSTIFSAVQIAEGTGHVEPFSDEDFAIRYLLTAALTATATSLRHLWKNKKDNLENLERVLDYLSAGTYAQLNIQLLLALASPGWQIAHGVVWTLFTLIAAGNAWHLLENSPEEKNDNASRGDEALACVPDMFNSEGIGQSAVVKASSVAHLPSVIGSPVFGPQPPAAPATAIHIAPAASATPTKHVATSAPK